MQNRHGMNQRRRLATYEFASSDGELDPRSPKWPILSRIVATPHYHHTSRKPIANPKQRRSRHATFRLPLPEDRSAIQSSIGEVLQRIAANDIDPAAPASPAQPHLPHARQSPLPPEIIAGTLPYMAPEQTGRMNRSIDARSDLYSLGVTLYQMLTGHLPFDAVDAMEWVHCHIARQPMPLDEKIPAPLSAIIMRLMAKTAEDRYQTCAGLETDLQRCLGEWETQGHIDVFPLGTQDVPDRLLIPERLYGREREINALLAAFDRVVLHGAPELVFVSGYSGVGKSSVVNELHKVLVPPRGLFAACKFDQYKRDIPYATLAQAFQTLVRQIVNLIPEVEFIIGKQPPVPDLPPRNAQNRFESVFRRFLGAFARPGLPRQRSEIISPASANPQGDS
jgi:serine/threonine protein kinase